MPPKGYVNVSMTPAERDGLNRLRVMMSGALERFVSTSEAVGIACELVFMHDLSIPTAAEQYARRREAPPVPNPKSPYRRR